MLKQQPLQYRANAASHLAGKEKVEHDGQMEKRGLILLCGGENVWVFFCWALFLDVSYPPESSRGRKVCTRRDRSGSRSVPALLSAQDEVRSSKKSLLTPTRVPGGQDVVASSYECWLMFQ